MASLLDEWKDRKGREDEQLHEQLRAAVLADRVQVFTDPRLLDYQGSPVHLHWDHLAPLIIMMTLALIILLAAGIAVGIVVMTLCVLGHLFGNKYYVAWRLKTRALAYMVESTAQFQTLWQMGGVALVMKGGAEAPCLAPKGDWRKFIRRNLGEGETQQQPAPMANAPVPVMPAAPAAPPAPPPPTAAEAEIMMAPPAAEPPPPSPFADSVQPETASPDEPSLSPKPGDHWASIADEKPPRDEVVP